MIARLALAFSASKTDPTLRPDKVAMLREKMLQIANELTDEMAPALVGKSLTMREISDLANQLKPKLLSRIVESFVAIHHLEASEANTAPCPECGAQCRVLRHRSRVVDTRHGKIAINRPYFFCRPCGKTFVPLDKVLELSGRRKQYDLQRLALDYIAEMPYARAAELFEKSTGISFSTDSLHALLDHFASNLTPEEVIPDQKTIAERIEKARGGSKRRPVLVVATDGAHVPLRPQGGRSGKRGQGEYREAKGFRMYLAGPGSKTVQIASWHQIGDAQMCVEVLKLAASRIPEDQVRIGLIGDGAGWLWRAMTEAFPSGRQVLDYFHCSEHVHAVAPLLYEDPVKAMQWAEATMTRLYYGEAGLVIGGLKRIKPRNDETAEAVRKLIGYLTSHKDRIDYSHNRRGGYPIGSGGIESANKFICHVRLKRNGAWWLKENSNNMLALRCAIVNGTLDEIFDRYVAKEQKKADAEALRLVTET